MVYIFAANICFTPIGCLVFLFVILLFYIYVVKASGESSLLEKFNSLEFTFSVLVFHWLSIFCLKVFYPQIEHKEQVSVGNCLESRTNYSCVVYCSLCHAVALLANANRPSYATLVMQRKPTCCNSFHCKPV